MTHATTVCVLGAGVMGLSTAWRIQQTIPSVEVTIIADSFSPETTSNVAAGYFRMTLFEKDQDGPRKRKWSEITWDHIESLYLSTEADKVGMELITGYRLNETLPANMTPYHAMREMTEKEKTLFPDYNSGFAQTTFLLEGGRYLPWLMNKFKAHGGKFVKKKLKCFSEVGDFDIIVNCIGGGAKHLIPDPDIKFIRGQIELMKAPWLKHFVFDTKNNIYMFPCQEYIVIGGTYQIYSEITDPEPKKVDRDKIMENASKILPGLKNADIVGEKVGFRPYRTTVRLEGEEIYIKSKKHYVVHNYGHGSYGIVLHWGCAIDAAKLVAKYLGKDSKL